MKIDFDPAKDDANRAKHGMSLADASLLYWRNVTRLQEAGPDKPRWSTSPRRR